jgi:glutamyl-tRNA synthetase
MIKVRFAPSPTGYLHVGGVRTALFNYLFARHHKGKFVLRIEDTDKQRSSEEYLKDILDSLNWLGLDWDEGPIFQSKRLPLYLEHAEKLLKEKKAYEEKTEKGLAIRFRPSQKVVEFNDMIRGKIEFSQGFEDIVLMKSDGTPTYNFACCIDDAFLGITHIIRGEDHISNTPKQILIYKALGFNIPNFAHLPLILGPDKTRLSKRHGVVSVAEYRRQGFLPQALFNFLSLLGWSPGDNREILSKKELIKLFDLDRINKSNAIFDIEKLKWMNKRYLKQVPEREFKERVLEFIKDSELKKKFLSLSEDKREKLYKLLGSRIKVYSEFENFLSYILKNDYRFEEQAVEKFLREDKIKQILKQLIEQLEKLEDFHQEKIENIIRSLAEEIKIEAKEIIHPLRVVLTGKEISPPLFELMEIIGKENVLIRLKNFLSY